MFKWRLLRGWWIIRMRNSERCRKLVSEIRWSMSEKSVSDSEWWRWLDQSDIRWSACVVTMRRLNGYKVIEIRWLSGIENFVSERDDFIFNSFRNFQPVKRLGIGVMCRNFGGVDNSSSKRHRTTVDALDSASAHHAPILIDLCMHRTAMLSIVSKVHCSDSCTEMLKRNQSASSHVFSRRRASKSCSTGCTAPSSCTTVRLYGRLTLQR